MEKWEPWFQPTCADPESKKILYKTLFTWCIKQFQSIPRDSSECSRNSLENLTFSVKHKNMYTLFIQFILYGILHDFHECSQDSCSSRGLNNFYCFWLLFSSHSKISTCKLNTNLTLCTATNCKRIQSLSVNVSSPCCIVIHLDEVFSWCAIPP